MSAEDPAAPLPDGDYAIVEVPGHLTYVFVTSSSGSEDVHFQWHPGLASTGSGEED